MSAARIAIALVASLAVSRATAAPPDVKALIPPGAQRGQAVEVRLVGTLPKGALRVWTSTDDLTFEPTAKPDRFTVRIDADAPPGPRWVRFISDEGPSLLKVFLVGAVAEATEVEPNDALEKAQKITADPLVVNGVLSQSGDVDCYRVSLIEGATFVASMDAYSAYGSPIDGVLQVTDAAGFVLARNQDERGFDPQIAFTAPADGDYIVRVFGIASVPNSSVRLSGSEDATYRLTLTTGPFAERANPAVVNAAESAEVVVEGFNMPGDKLIALPPDDRGVALRRPVETTTAGCASVVSMPQPVLTEGNGNFAAKPGVLKLPMSVGGVISRPDEVDAFVVQAAKGESFRIRACAKALASPLDPVVHVYKPDGTLLVRLDDVSRTDNDVVGDATVSVEGEYRVTVEDVFGGGGERYFYVLDVRPTASDFGLSVAAAETSAVLGKETEIAVTIDRPRGMTADVEIRLEGVPGLNDVSVTSPNKGAEAKKVSLKFTPMKAYAGPLRIVGRIVDQPNSERVATAAFAAIPNMRTEHLWLTIADKAVEPLPAKKK